MPSNISEITQKSKDIAHEALSLIERRDVFLILLILGVAFASFGLGRLSTLEAQKEPVRLEQSASAVNSAKEQGSARKPIGGAKGQFVGSVNSDKYHYPWCSGANRIKEENKIWFSSKEEARAAGYTPAGNCKGL